MEKTETTAQRGARMEKKFEKILERRKQKVQQDMLKTIKKRTKGTGGKSKVQKWERGLMIPGLRKANIAAAAREPTVKRKTISKPSILKEMDQYKAKKDKAAKSNGLERSREKFIWHEDEATPRIKLKKPKGVGKDSSSVTVDWDQLNKLKSGGKVKGYKKGGPITYRMTGGQVVDNSYD